MTLAFAGLALFPNEREAPAFISGIIVYGGCAAVVGVAYLYLRRSDRTRKRITRDGRPCLATVVSKRDELIGLGFGGGNVKMYVRLRIEREPPNAPLEFESEVDDLVYHRSSVGGTIGIKILDNDPQSWVFDDPRAMANQGV